MCILGKDERLKFWGQKVTIHGHGWSNMVEIRVSTPGPLYSAPGSGFCDANPGDVRVGVCLLALITNNITDTYTIHMD